MLTITLSLTNLIATFLAAAPVTCFSQITAANLWDRILPNVELYTELIVDFDTVDIVANPRPIVVLKSWRISTLLKTEPPVLILSTKRNLQCVSCIYILYLRTAKLIIKETPKDDAVGYNGLHQIAMNLYCLPWLYFFCLLKCYNIRLLIMFELPWDQWLGNFSLSFIFLSSGFWSPLDHTDLWELLRASVYRLSLIIAIHSSLHIKCRIYGFSGWYHNI